MSTVDFCTVTSRLRLGLSDPNGRLWQECYACISNLRVTGCHTEFRLGKLHWWLRKHWAGQNWVITGWSIVAARRKQRQCGTCLQQLQQSGTFLQQLHTALLLFHAINMISSGRNISEMLMVWWLFFSNFLPGAKRSHTAFHILWRLPLPKAQRAPFPQDLWSSRQCLLWRQRVCTLHLDWRPTTCKITGGLFAGFKQFLVVN
jgi:hypothetical protein